MKRSIYSAAICVVMLIALNTKANVFVIDQKQILYDLEHHMMLFHDVNQRFNQADFNNQEFLSKFQSSSALPFELYSNQIYWGRIQIENKLKNAYKYQEWVLKFSTTWSEMDVYIQLADGTVEQERNGAFVPHANKAFKATTEGNLMKLTLPPHEVINIYFRGKSLRNSIPPNKKSSLQHADDFYKSLQHRKTGTTIFVGFVLMMLLYNLILYFFGRDSSFIYYSIYLFSLVIYASFISEDFADWFESSLFPNHPQYLYLGKFVIYLGLMSYLVFVRRFLDLEQLLPKWDRLFQFLFWLGLPLFILDLVLVFTSNFSYVVADKVTVLYIILFIVSTFVFLYPLFRTRDKKGYFIFVGFIFMGLGFLFTAISRGLTPSFSLLYFKIGTILEIIVFSLGLAYRQSEIEKDKQSASFELEKSKLLQKQEQAEAERLKELDEFKSRFYTNITHEFRTPLTVILGMNENIKGHINEKNLIRRNSKNLLQLINQLLDLSKLESGNLQVNMIQRDIVPYLQYLTESFYSLATEKGIRLTFYSEEEKLLMDFDEVKIQHIVYNLLSNAIKFTPKSGKIILHLSKIQQKHQAHLKVKVKDSGVGIEQEKIPYIFDRFYQVKNDTNLNKTSSVGSGIGLALTKELVQMMNGNIKVSSTPGTGTEFTLLLPIQRKADRSATILDQRTNKDVYTGSTKSLHLELIDDLHINDNPDAVKLLLIEDNPDVVIYIKSILEDRFLISIANNGQAGIDRAIEMIPDIIISDVMMPEKDGYEVCETLKQDQRTSHIPIILLTAKATTDDRIQGLKFGADAYLTKPFNKEELLVRLEKLVELRQKLQLHYSDGSKELKTELPAIEDEFIKSLKNIIRENIGDSTFGVNEAAKSMLMSHTQIYRKLKALTGKTPSQFIRSIRLQKGMELLKTTQLNISEIAYDVGFSDPNYFSKTFHEQFGCAPRDIRK